MSGRGRRIVVCLDGTWNNAQKESTRRDSSKVYKPTNVLKFARAVRPLDDEGRSQLTLYYSGVGAIGRYGGVANWFHTLSDRVLGGATGAGFEANLETPITFLANNFDEGDEIFVVGFSRGAAQARALTHFLDWMGGIPQKKDAYFVPLFFRDYLESRGLGNPFYTRTERSKKRPGPLRPFRIRFLGVWDTVQAHGPAFLLRTCPARCVENAYHAIALDERRATFKPEIWREAQDGQVMEQRWFPGVHSNVGGGYLQDGLANVSFKWMLANASNLGLQTDDEFTDYYTPWPQGRLYDSKDWKYKLWDGIRWKDGARSLRGCPESANLRIDESVLVRMRSDPFELNPDRDDGDPPELHWQMDKRWYRPTNVRAYFESTGRVDQLPVDHW